jgi:hypothetical protein
MKKITHLVVNGCSWTYCQGLDNRLEQGWPWLVAKELGVNIINLAIQGCGNDSIHRRTYEYVLGNLPEESNPFFIIAWSQFWRQEGWYEKLEGKKYQNYKIIAKPIDVVSLDEYQNCLMTHWNTEHHFRKTLLYKASLKSLFLSQDIPYLMSDYGDDYPRMEEYYSRYQKQINFVYDKRHIQPFWEKTCGYPKTPCRHDGPESQIVLKDYIVDEIKRRLEQL